MPYVIPSVIESPFPSQIQIYAEGISGYSAEGWLRLAAAESRLNEDLSQFRRDRIHPVDSE